MFSVDDGIKPNIFFIFWLLIINELISLFITEIFDEDLSSVFKIVITLIKKKIN